jgi:1,4-alpha-glucan branching enzyme
MIRLLTMASAGHGYLNFMGNEFGHPEWIDFPREGNNWSYQYARRQWSLADDPGLYYSKLGNFDEDMVQLMKSWRMPKGQKQFLLHLDEHTKVIAFLRANRIFAFNFHPQDSHTDYWIPAAPGKYRVELDTDNPRYGGLDRQDRNHIHHCITDEIDRHFLSLYLPARTAIVLAPARTQQ